MKKIKHSILVSAFIVVASLSLFVGCVQPNPKYDNSLPVSAVNPAYVPYTDVLSNRLEQVKSTVAVIAPAQAPIVNTALDGVLGIGTLLSVALAYFKNKSSAKHQAAAISLAQTVKAGNLVQQALANAPSPDIAASIAAHLQNT